MVKQQICMSQWHPQLQQQWWSSILQCWAIASFPGHSQILSCSFLKAAPCWENSSFLHSCTMKSGSGLGMRLAGQYFESECVGNNSIIKTTHGTSWGTWWNLPVSLPIFLHGEEPSLIPKLSPQKNGREESLVTSVGKVVDFWRLALVVPIRHVYTWHSVHSAKNYQLENEPISVDYTSKVGQKQFSNVRMGRGTSLESPKSKFAVVGLWDRLTHHTLQLRVYMYKVRRRTQQSCGCLKDEERNSLCCYQVYCTLQVGCRSLWIPSDNW